MIIQNIDNNTHYIGNINSNLLFNINKSKIENINNDEKTKLTINKVGMDNLKAFTDYHYKILRILNILVNSKNIPKIIGFIKDNNRLENKVDLFRKEFIVYNMDNLDKSIGKLYGKVLIEFVVLDESIDIQELLDFGRLNKCSILVSTLCDIPDTDTFLSSKAINKLLIPTYIQEVLNKNTGAKK